MSFGLSAAAVGMISAGASLVGGAISADAAGDAAETQAASADRAAALNKEMFDKQVELAEPFRQSGIAARNRLMHLLGLEGEMPQARTSSNAMSNVLTAGADGVYSPAGGAAPMESVESIRARLAPQFTGKEQRWMSGSGENVFEEVTPGQVDQAALDAAVQDEMQRQRAMTTDRNVPAAAPVPSEGGDGFTGYGSLTRPFGQADFDADAAPKIADFAEPAPQYEKFDLADFEADPGYQFRLEEGQKALERSAANRGGLFSGAVGKALQRYGQGVASDEFGRAFGRYQTEYGNRVNDHRDSFARHQTNRSNKMADYLGAFDRYQIGRSNVMNPMLSMMGVGQTATGQVSGAAQNYGNVAGAAITGAGNARAAGQVGASNAWNNAIGQGVGAYQSNRLMDMLQRPKAPSVAYPTGMYRYDD